MSFTPEILNTVQFFAGRPMYETETYFPSYNASDFMTLDEDTFGDNVQRVYEAIRPYESDDGNYRFEIATFGSENAGGGDVIFFPTYSSSLTGNNGNVAEMAMKAMAYRGNRFTYVALPGNGLSSPLTRKERKHFTQTGSFYDAHEGTVLPVVTALQEVLREADIVPRHFMSDSAGAAMSDALGMALPKDSVWTVTQNVRTGWRGMGKLELAKGMLLDENKHAEIYKTSSSDAGAVTDALKQLVDDNRPSSYDAKNFSSGKSIPTLISYLAGLSLGPERGKNPLLNDMTLMAARQHPDRITFIAQKDDILTKDVRTETYRNVARELSYVSMSMVTVLLLNGSHTTHTYFPRYIDRLRRV